MPTDVSSFKDAYKTAIKSDFPKDVSLTIGDRTQQFRHVKVTLRYGTNPHQPFAAYYPMGHPLSHPLSVGNLSMLKEGKDGLSLTNLQDMSQSLNILKYFPEAACTIMKHLNPCGFKVRTNGESLEQLFRIARKCDERSAFGGVIGFNREVDAKTAEAIMEDFIECIIAPAYTEEALEILRRTEGTKKLNNGVRVGKVTNIDQIPKFIGDDTTGLFNLRTLVDGSLTLETPYLTRIRSKENLIFQPMIPNTDPNKNDGKNYIAQKVPLTEREVNDCLTAWWLNINVRSNGIVIVKDGAAISVGTGQQERVGAVEQALDKARSKGHAKDLDGAVLSSDGFFPKPDSIERIAEYKISTVVWPAGSMSDALIIEVANKFNIALVATLERCFLHI